MSSSMRHKSSLILIGIALLLLFLGHSSIENSIGLGIKDKYGSGVMFGRWFYLGALFACLPSIRLFSDRHYLKWLIVPFALWITFPTLALVGAATYDIWF